MVHPEKYTLHKEFRDYWIRDRVCRELELEYSLTVDNGRGQASPGRERLSDVAATLEAHTGQQSFESYAKAHRDTILQTLGVAGSWQDFHEALAAYSMEITPRGNGLAVKDRHSRRAARAIKASTLDSALSRKKLEGRFGPYAPPQNLEAVKAHSRYDAAPLQRSPERGEIYAEYRIGIEARKEKLRDVQEQEEAALADICEHWAAKRRELEQKNIAKRNKRNLLRLARKHEAEALATAKLAFQEAREAVRREIPFVSWNGFLRQKAELGNEAALAILRSRTECVEMEKSRGNASPKDWSQHGMARLYADKAAMKVEYAEKELAALEQDDLTGKSKNRLLAVLRMEQLAEEERLRGARSGRINGEALLAGFTFHVDHKGAVIFILSGGGRIRDSGRELYFSANDKKAEAAARLYARAKWGKAVSLDGNRISREENREHHHGVGCTP